MTGNSSSHRDGDVPRRDFLKLSAVAGLAGALGAATRLSAEPSPAPGSAPQAGETSRKFAAPYAGAHLSRVAFPLGGLGAGMICVEGTGALSHVSLRHKPDVFNEPCQFAAIAFPGRQLARVLEGPVPDWKLYGRKDAGMGAPGQAFGLPRFASARFSARFPFATVALADAAVPFAVELTAWSPFTPGDADSSSLPVAALDYRFTNPTREPVDAVFSFSAKNFMALRKESAQAIRAIPGGFEFWGAGTEAAPWEEGSFAATVSEPATKVNHAWFRGAWVDSMMITWREIAAGQCFDRPPVTDGAPAPGATLFVPFHLEPGASRTITLRLCWYVARTNLRFGPAAPQPEDQTETPEAWNARQPVYAPWYPAQFPHLAAVAAHWEKHCDGLRRRSEDFAQCLFDTTLPPEVVEAVSANLSILKSPTVLRQADGRLWGWEGCGDQGGLGTGSCTHVWNYAQALAHLFPSLERTLRATEFGESQDERGHQAFRAALPIRPAPHGGAGAADGQLGGIMKVHRDWRISADTAWLRGLWPRVRQSLDYCIGAWDPARQGWLVEPQSTTYDRAFWGPNGMGSTVYLGALQAAIRMGRALGDDVSGYQELFDRGLVRVEAELFDGDCFIQKTEWKTLRTSLQDRANNAGRNPSAEALALLEKEGPFYQYGPGCLSDGVIGAWFAQVCGLGQIGDPAKIASHLRAVHRHNLKADLAPYANPLRSSYAAGHDGGLLLCTWPKGGQPTLPMLYSTEVWTGIEYQVASHLIMMGLVDEGLEIVRVCRARYDGRARNPFAEYEYGHWYARALSSYALLQAMSGARYDAIDQVLHLAPPRAGDFRCFLATATGYGTVGVRNGQPFLDVRSGAIPVKSINYTPREA